MFKKISRIQNMGVFKDFSWDASVRDHGNNIVSLEKISIFYGRNYSGKTTLSKILRAVENSELPPKYQNPQFVLEDDEGENISHSSLDKCKETIRVFNRDFVEENLRFIIDEESDVNSFAILGESNAQIEEQIKKLNVELGVNEEIPGLYQKVASAKKSGTQAEDQHEEAIGSLNEKLRDKARSIKENNSLFGNVNYNVTKINEDIESVKEDSYSPISSEEETKNRELLKEETKNTIPDIGKLESNLSVLIEKTKSLTERKITITTPIQELIDSSLLQKWVREGRDLHKGKRDLCGFCHNPLPSDLWKKLDKHFNKESEELRNEITTLIEKIGHEGERISINIDNRNFYTTFHDELNKIRTEHEKESEIYLKATQSLVRQLDKRKNNVAKNLIFEPPSATTSQLSNIQEKLKNIITESNKYSKNLDTRQKEAKDLLRLKEVYKFISDIKYDAELSNRDKLQKNADEKKEYLENIENEVKKKEANITSLQNQLGDESIGADKVNDILNNHFGHDYLSLQSIKDESDPPKYRFEVRRNNSKAYNLSEGERSLIAFCYFIAKLDDINTKDRNPIIWIDDPVSSLDSNHTFFIFSLIQDKIIKCDKYNQLFISTHNLDFLKHIKSISSGRGKNSNNVDYFLLERENETSKISVMPKYLKEYITEFNYLFHQILKCADANNNDENHPIFYNFGNNARKFLEIFLYYRYPDMSDHHQKMKKFFSDENIPPILIRRMGDEYSHISGGLERGHHPVEMPAVEMQKAAQSILNRIKEKDKDQYDALIKSTKK